SRVTFSFSPLSLHDALPISIVFIPESPAGSRAACCVRARYGIFVSSTTKPVGDEEGRETMATMEGVRPAPRNFDELKQLVAASQDRKSTRLNSSHVKISYAV